MIVRGSVTVNLKRIMGKENKLLQACDINSCILYPNSDKVCPRTYMYMRIILIVTV